jgi:hypothetical protein
MLTDSFEIWHRGWSRLEDVWEGSFFFDHHGGRKVGPIVFTLVMNIAKYKDMPCDYIVTTEYNVSPIVFILSELVAKSDNMPYG